MVGTGQGVYPGLQGLENDPFLLKGFVVLHGDGQFHLGGIHHDDLLVGGHLTQGEDLDPVQIIDLLPLYDVESILHSTVVHLFVGVEHPLLLKDVDRLLPCVDVDHLLPCADVDHLLHSVDVDRLLLCIGIDHHHLLDGEGHLHPHPLPCDEDLLLGGIGHLHQCAECHQPMHVIDQALPCNRPLPYVEGMAVKLHNAGLHLRCIVDHLFFLRKGLQVFPHEGLLEMNGVLSLQYGMHLHLQLGEILQDREEAL